MLQINRNKTRFKSYTDSPILKRTIKKTTNNNKSAKSVNKKSTKSVNKKSTKSTIPVVALSYNISWAAQTNQAAGTEKEFVERCQEKFSKKNMNIQGGKYCHHQAIKNLKDIDNIDILGFQEVNSNVEKKVSRYQKKLNKVVRGNIGLSTVLTMWNSDKLGLLLEKRVFNLTTHNLFIDDRPCLITLLKKDNMYTIIINLHAPYKLNSKKISSLISKQLNDMEIVPNIISNSTNIVILGDFNDAKGNINKYNPLVLSLKSVSIDNKLSRHDTRTKYKLNINNIKLKISHNMTKTKLKKKMKTCCWRKDDDRYFKKVGDYIMTSDNIKQYKFGIPKKYNQDILNSKKTKDHILFSDHKPVISYLTFQNK